MTTPSAPETVCWVVSDGRRGIENQALGLAEAIGRHLPLSIDIKHVPQAGVLSFLTQRRRDVFEGAPWPDLWVACGRSTLDYSERVKDWSGGKTFTVQLQDPKRPPSRFDLVVPPHHDGLTGDNVIPMLGSPNRIIPSLLDQGVASFKAQLDKLARPKVAVLIGGTSKRHKLTGDICIQHCSLLQSLIRRGAGIMLSTSRRTPANAVKAYRAVLEDSLSSWIYDGDGDNPYFAFLGAADAILVSEDSTNMLTEACATGKPVFRLPMAGDPGKFAILYQALAERCHVVPFTGELETLPYAPLDETDRVARDIAARFQAAKGQTS